METEVVFGNYSVPLVLTILLAITYKYLPALKDNDKYKAAIAVGIGILLGILVIPYKGLDWSIITIVDYSLYGLMTGAAAVGLYELQRTVTKPR